MSTSCAVRCGIHRFSMARLRTRVAINSLVMSRIDRRTAAYRTAAVTASRCAVIAKDSADDPPAGEAIGGAHTTSSG